LIIKMLAFNLSFVTYASKILIKQDIYNLQ